MKRKTLLFIAMIAMVAFAANSAATSRAAGDFAVGTTLENFTLTDINGKDRSYNDLKGKNGAVLIWLSAQCPVVKQYNDRINEVAAMLEKKGIAVIGINSNVSESLEWVKSHAEENYKFPMLIDKGNVLADKLGATVTPEVYYFNAENVLLYHGAIDNDRSGKNVSTQYLKDAIKSALAGAEITTKKTNAFGCAIKRVEAE